MLGVVSVANVAESGGECECFRRVSHPILRDGFLLLRSYFCALRAFLYLSRMRRMWAVSTNVINGSVTVRVKNGIDAFRD